jgi:glycine cleavage system H protein
MSKIIEGLLYSEDHEWVRAEGDLASIGITDYAQAQLGDLVFADAEPEGSEIAAGEAIGVVESVKAASDVLSPLSCVISEVNRDALDNPERITADPYESWLVKVSLSDTSELDALMDAGAYRAYLETL